MVYQQPEKSSHTHTKKGKDREKEDLESMTHRMFANTPIPDFQAIAKMSGLPQPNENIQMPHIRVLLDDVKMALQVIDKNNFESEINNLRHAFAVLEAYVEGVWGNDKKEKKND